MLTTSFSRRSSEAGGWPDTQTLRFSPDGHALTIFGPRAALDVWSTDSDHIATRLCRLVAEHHWAQLLPDQPVRGLCPA
ncbi:hypothetical protein [Streptomyces sp. Ac-502]|uniref:hypothetical protein n=1 Tax=Streptomyces sp. Ac-502 TaxID=3342801 RepID=UPI00386257F6